MDLSHVADISEKSKKKKKNTNKLLNLEHWYTKDLDSNRLDWLLQLYRRLLPNGVQEPTSIHDPKIHGRTRQKAKMWGEAGVNGPYRNSRSPSRKAMHVWLDPHLNIGIKCLTRVLVFKIYSYVSSVH